MRRTPGSLRCEEHLRRYHEKSWSLQMSAFVTAILMGAALLAVAVWVEVHERRAAPGDGNYRSSGQP